MNYTKISKLALSLALSSSLFLSASASAVNIMYLPGQNPNQTNTASKGSLTRSSGNENTANFENGTRVMYLPNQSLVQNNIQDNSNNSSNFDSNSCDNQLADKMLAQINGFRRQNGVREVSPDKTLSDVACGHSEWMNNNDDLSHYGVNGTDPFQRCENAGTSCNAENVAYHSAKDLDVIMEYFKKSPSHRTNLLNSDYSKVGVGLSGIYATQVFAE